jgi:hypothetical protein
MKIVALYKTFEGEEFVIPSIESIYNYVDKIVFINSNVSWNGKVGNTVFSVVEKYKKNYDKDNKIINIIGEWRTQPSQYEFGVKYIQNNFKSDYIMLIDTDEIWTDNQLNECMNRLHNDNFKHDAFSCRMFTYIKSVFYRITPTEPCRPTIFVKSNIKTLNGIRGNGVINKIHLDNIKFHHFCYVRKNIDTIKNKFKTSEIGDTNKSRDWNEWKVNVWDKLPNNVENFHPTIGAEKCWNKIEIVKKEDLPNVIQNDMYYVLGE